MIWYIEAIIKQVSEMNKTERLYAYALRKRVVTSDELGKWAEKELGKDYKYLYTKYITRLLAQGKLVRVSRGVVWDVGVDLRVGSPTFGAWVGVELAEGEGKMLYLPPGLAHGYLVLSEKADLAYKVTAEYAPELDTGIRWDDPEIGIEWPLPDPLLSQKDLELPFLKEIQSPFSYLEGEGR